MVTPNEVDVSENDDFTLDCFVNLPVADLEDVAWYFSGNRLPNKSNSDYLIDFEPQFGMYSITVLNAGAEDTGLYECEAVTIVNGVELTRMDIANIDVLGELCL